MKRNAILVLVAAMVMLAICATASATSTYYVTGTFVRVRTGPGTDYDIMYKVSLGEKVQVEKISHGWATIITNSKGWQYYGYMSSKYISKSKPILSNPCFNFSHLLRNSIISCRRFCKRTSAL